jgi:RimJ/RimL family protein N-acetyltransferase
VEHFELSAADLTLRPWRAGDAEAVHRACQDLEIQRWTRVPAPYGLEHARRFVTGTAPDAWAAGTGVPLGVFDSGTGELLGSAGLVRLDAATGVAELGYWTAPWARGRSVAERACRLLASWAFEQLKVRRLVWRAKVGNHLSRLVALRLGFTMEGTSRAEDDGVDVWVGALLTGELRDTADPIEPRLIRAARQAATFLGDQPELAAGIPSSEAAASRPVRGAAGATTPGESIRLRPLREADIPDIVVASGDPDMARFTTVPDPYRTSDADFFVELGRRQWCSGDGAVFAVTDTDDRYCGAIDLRLGSWPARIADVGYSVAPWARGRGFGTAALRAICRFGFESLALDRVEWRAYTTNPASRRVAEKAGFVIEGTERGRLLHRGKPVETWYGALLAADLG